MRTGQHLRRLFSDTRFQIIYGLALMVLIPAAIVVATLQIIERYSQTVDITLQRQALLVGRVFGAALWREGVNPAILQRQIEAVGSANPDILSLQVLTPQEDGAFLVAASLPPESVGRVVSLPYYALAWQQAEREGLATDFLGSAAPEGLAVPLQRDRYWLVSLPLFADPDGDGRRERVALLSLQLSSAIVDRQAEASWRAAIISLTLTVLLTVLFLAAATRLWNYATLYRKIEEVDRMKDEFISIASHELRTPITALRGYLAMVIAGDFGSLAPAVRTGLGRADASAKRLGELVEDLLNVSRIEQGRITIEPKSLDLSLVTRGVVEELTAAARERNLSLNFHPVADPSPQIVADPDKLKQVLVNIVGNALKYTLQGAVDVSVRRDEDRSVGVVKVKDTGIGIPAEDQARLFSKFFRVANDHTRKISGTGLGLWITKQLVELMHGKIAVESIEGTGTQVTVQLPLVSAAALKGKAATRTA